MCQNISIEVIFKMLEFWQLKTVVLQQKLNNHGTCITMVSKVINFPDFGETLPFDLFPTYMLYSIYLLTFCYFPRYVTIFVQLCCLLFASDVLNAHALFKFYFWLAFYEWESLYLICSFAYDACLLAAIAVIYPALMCSKF